VPGVPQYPQILLDADWQKHKGVIAKIVKGETGIGAKLKKLYDVHTKETKWYVFDPKMPGSPGKPRTREELNQRMAEAKAQGGAIIEGYRKEVLAVKTHLEAEAKKLSNPLLKSTRSHIEKMADAALNLATAAKSIDLSPFDDIRKEIERTEEVGRKMLADWVKSCEEGIKKVRATPTLAEYEASLHQKVRGLNTALARIPEYQDWGDKNWKALAQDKFRAGKQDGDPIKQLATVVDTQLQKFKAIYK
jgi:hypothetical protein